MARRAGRRAGRRARSGLLLLSGSFLNFLLLLAELLFVDVFPSMPILEADVVPIIRAPAVQRGKGIISTSVVHRESSVR